MKSKIGVLLATVIGITLIGAGCAGTAEKKQESQVSASTKESQESQAPEDAKETQTAAVTEAKGNIKIGVTVDTLDQPYFQACYQAMEEKAAELGVEIVQAVAEGDSTKQNQQIENLIAQGVDAIVGIPVDCDAILEGVKKANEQSIPFVFSDRVVESSSDAKVDYGYGTDNYELAKSSAQWLCDYLRENNIKGKAVMYVGDLGDSNANARKKGFEEVIEANSDVVEVIATVNTEWDLDKALSGTINVFQANPEINVIFSPADYILPSIKSGLQQAGRWVKRDEEGHVYMTTFDGSKSALDAIKDGYIECDGAQPVVDTGANAIQAAYDLVNGKTFTDKYSLNPGFVVNIDNFDETSGKAYGYISE